MRHYHLRYKAGLWTLLSLALVTLMFGAWQSAGRKFENLWLTPDQQGDRHMAFRDFAGAAKLYQDVERRGVALYLAEDFKAAAAEFGREQTAEAAFNRGNALVMLGKYDEAIRSYDLALKRRPDFSIAAHNREIAVARNQALRPQNDGSEGTDGKLAADKLVFDDRPPQAPGKLQTQVVTGGVLTDDQVQALWLRRVQTKPADFLRAKFAYQLGRREAEKQP